MITQHLARRQCIDITDFILLNFWCFNATFNNILAISGRPVLVVEEAGVPGKNHRPHGQATGKLYHLRLLVKCTLLSNLQSRARTHAVLVISLCELYRSNDLTHWATRRYYRTYKELEFWCLTPLSAIFQIYHGDQF